MSRRYDNLYERVCGFENLWMASRKARLGKRRKAQTAAFEFDLESNLLRIKSELERECYEFGAYRQFVIHEPKERLISAAPYVDRVVHHAICRVVEPILDRAMIHDTYACRPGKGSHKAVARAHRFLRGSAWVLKMDIRKYFFCIDHDILCEELSRKLADERLMKLLTRVLRTYTSPAEYYHLFDGDTLFDFPRGRGLPIGNLTSQLFANYYLSGLDRYIKEKLKCAKYIRYMDDFLLFADDKQYLISARDEITAYLATRRLNIHEGKSHVFPRKNGVAFLGFHLSLHEKRILRANIQRFRRRMKQHAAGHARGEIERSDILLSLNAWLGYADKRLNQKIINSILHHIEFTSPGRDTCFTFVVT